MPNTPAYYYYLKPNTAQYDRALELNQEAEEFVKQAQAFTDRNGAVAFTLSITLGNPFSFSAEPRAGEISLLNLRYIDNSKVPPDWRVTKSGYFEPKTFSKERDAIVLPLSQLAVNEGFFVKFFNIDDDVLLAVDSKNRPTRPRIAVAEPLSLEEVQERLKDVPSWDEMGCKIAAVMPTLEYEEQTSPLDKIGGFTSHWNYWSRVHAPLARCATGLNPEKKAALYQAERQRRDEWKRSSFAPTYPGLSLD